MWRSHDAGSLVMLGIARKRDVEKKVNMKIETSEVVEGMNVVALHSVLGQGENMEVESEEFDFFIDLDLEEEVQEMAPSKAVRYLVKEDQFPDQSMHVLDQQLSGLRDSMERLKFYLADLEDLIPS